MSSGVLGLRVRATVSLRQSVSCSVLIVVHLRQLMSTTSMIVMTTAHLTFVLFADHIICIGLACKLARLILVD